MILFVDDNEGILFLKKIGSSISAWLQVTSITISKFIKDTFKIEDSI